MQNNHTELERAFQLARSGNVQDVDRLIRQLKSEGYTGNHVEGKSIRLQLALLTERAIHPPLTECREPLREF
jgi:hypothetical protein